MQRFVIELVVVLATALVGGVTSYKLKQPLVVGYLVSGIVLGNLFPKNLLKSEFIPFIAELGIAFLLFSLGLEFSISKIERAKKAALLGGISQVVLTMSAGYLVFVYIFRLGNLAALFSAILVSFSSTAVVAKILDEMGVLESLYGEILIGWLIVQDLLVLPVMAMIPTLGSSGSPSLYKLVLLSLGKSLLVLYLILIFGRRLLPKIFVKFALLRNRELMVLLSFVICVAFSFGAYLIGVSFALGAFLAGIALSSSGVNEEVFSEIKSIRDVFASVFFVSLGSLVSIHFLYSSIFKILLLTLIILILKFLIVFGLTLYFNYHSRVAFMVGIGLVQIGEFSFILAKIGFDRGILSHSVYQMLLPTAVLTIVVTPFLFENSDRLYLSIRGFVKARSKRFYKKIFVLSDRLSLYSPEEPLGCISDHVILIGYGRVGHYVGRILDEAKLPYVVIDLNFNNLNYLRKRGIPNIFGDATDEDILKLAGVERAKVLIVAKPNIYENEYIVRLARRFNGQIKIVIRVHSEKEAAFFVLEGVKFVIEPEFEAGIEIGNKALSFMGVKRDDRKSLVEKIREEHRY